MDVMLAYDHSRNARIALDAVREMFGPLKPTVTLISVIEDVGSATGEADELFSEQYAVQKSGVEAAAAELLAAGMPAKVILAEGFYAGWGNFGSAAAAMTIPTVALVLYGGPDGWRWAVATSGAIMALYGVFYWFAITDGPTADTHRKPRKAMALEVSSYRDLALLVVFTVPLIGILSILVYRVQRMGYIDGFVAATCYAAIVVLVIYQVWQVLRVNLPILRQGVPEDDRYPFSSVAALNTTYFANFGAELAVVSMLPMFFQETWGLTPVTAGLIAASFAFINLVARPMGGLVSDRMGNRRFVMLAYMLGIAIGFALMGLLNSSWPLIIAIAITIACSFFVQGAEGATFGIIPSIKRRVTGQIAGMAGAYGNVGAVFYLFIFMFVDASTFFFIIAAGALMSWVVCYFWLKEPEGGFGEEYVLSSVDEAIAAEATRRKEAEAELALIFEGSEKVALAEKGDSLTVTAKFKDLNDLKSALARLGPRPGQQPAE